MNNKLIQYSAVVMITIYGIGCGFTTAAYIYQAIRAKFADWAIYSIMAICALVFISGAFLNIVLYMRDVFPSDEADKSVSESNLLSEIIGTLLTVLTAAAVGIFTYNAFAMLPWDLMGINLSTLLSIQIIMAVASGVATFYLFRKANVEAIYQLKDFMKNIVNLKWKPALLTIIFGFGTAGYIKSLFESLLPSVGIELTLIFVIAVIISEAIFIYGEAETFFENTLPSMFNNKCLHYLVFALVAIAILTNGMANGVLDAFTLTGNFASTMVVCGTILSVILMLNSMVKMFFKPKGSDPSVGEGQPFISSGNLTTGRPSIKSKLTGEEVADPKATTPTPKVDI